MEKIKSKTFLRKLGWHLLMALCVAVYACGLVLLCEASARTEFSTFRSFLQTDIARITLRNTAVLVMLLIVALYFLTTKISAAMAIVSIPLLICHMISAFKLQFRNEPFYPWDVTLAGEATNILSSINLSFSKAMILAIVYVLIALAIALTMDVLVLRKNRPRYRVSLACFAVALAAFAGCSFNWFSESYIKENTVAVRVYNEKLTYRENGFVYAFASNVYHARTEAPEDYSAASIAEIAQGYTGTEGSVQPNVIIVMSEAFADIWNAENLHFDEDLAPTFTALAQQYLTGNCMTSEYGGNTANCEFEVLTSYSTYLLPTGTVPYMSYLNQASDNYVSFLNSSDYYTVALHPYQRSFFSREKAYELLGFDDFYSEEHFEDAERLRYMKYVSDDAVADRIIAEFEKNQQTDQGFFCHVVTMLNHTSYHLSDWPEELRVGMTADCELTETEYNVLRSYATGVQYADAMLAKLVDYFQQVDEPTVILFFGDHQPSLGSPGYELMQRIGYVDDNTSVEGVLALQSTPYLIWNNFQEEPEHAEIDLSMFQLLPYMTRMLDMDRPGFYTYMDSLFEETRGVTRTICLDGEGNPVWTLTGMALEKFQEYLELVYDGLLGKQYASELLYP